MDKNKVLLSGLFDLENVKEINRIFETLGLKVDIPINPKVYAATVEEINDNFIEAKRLGEFETLIQYTPIVFATEAKVWLKRIDFCQKNGIEYKDAEGKYLDVILSSKAFANDALLKVEESKPLGDIEPTVEDISKAAEAEPTADEIAAIAPMTEDDHPFGVNTGYTPSAEEYAEAHEQGGPSI